MPAFVCAFAMPLFLLTGYMLNRLHKPLKEDISERIALYEDGHNVLFMKYAPFMSNIFFESRDIKDDLLVNIFDIIKHPRGYLYALMALRQ